MKTRKDYTLAEFRDLLGVPPGRYKSFGELNKHVLKPVVAEVNALAPFTVSVVPIKEGKRVVRIMVSWLAKDDNALGEALQEVRRTKLGRRARVRGLAELVIDPQPSISRLFRATRTGGP